MKKIFKALLAGTVALAPVAAFAAIDGTHHDMTRFASQEKCAYCHAKTVAPQGLGYGKVGEFCVVVCHNAAAGIQAQRPNVVPDKVEVFNYAEDTTDGVGTLTFTPDVTLAPDGLKDAHGFDAGLLVDVAGEANQNTMIGTNWPHIELDGIMECTSCHAVHDSTNPPFLNARYDGFCERCHSAKSGDYTTTNGNHPTNFSFNSANALGYTGIAGNVKTGDAATFMNARTLRVQGVNAPANVYANIARGAAGANPGATMSAAGSIWNLAGHVLETAGAGVIGMPTQNVGAGGVGTNRFGCYSCHNAHQNSVTSPTTEPLVAPAILKAQNVLLVSGDPLAALADTSDVCYGCHGDDANPSDAGNTNYGHPINDEIVISDTQVVPWVVPLTANGQLPAGEYQDDAVGVDTPKCLACHDIHGGQAGLMNIRHTAVGGSACNACHAVSFTPNVADSHHPGQNLDYTAAGNGQFVTLATPGAGGESAWGTVDNHGNLADGLSCPDCHVGDGNALKRSTAHNWERP